MTVPQKCSAEMEVPFIYTEEITMALFLPLMSSGKVHRVLEQSTYICIYTLVCFIVITQVQMSANSMHIKKKTSQAECKQYANLKEDFPGLIKHVDDGMVHKQITLECVDINCCTSGIFHKWFPGSTSLKDECFQGTSWETWVLHCAFATLDMFKVCKNIRWSTPDFKYSLCI